MSKGPNKRTMAIVAAVLAAAAGLLIFSSMFGGSDDVVPAPPVAPTTTPAPPAPPCTAPGGIPGGSCQPCKENTQCSSGFCCPFMKKCVSSSSQSCSYPIANCRPTCFTATCSSCSPTDGSDYNSDWGLPTCSVAPVSQPQPSSSVWVDLTNAKRGLHGACPLTWSQDMADGMKDWVDGLTTGMVHSDSYHLPPPQGPAGENLAQSSGRITPETSVSMWYNEEHDCASLPGCQEGVNGAVVGHFTALVWKGAREMGCAISDNGNFAGCRYRAGDTLSGDTPNMRGHYVENVGSLGETASAC